MNYQARIDTLRTAMEREGLAAVLLPINANSEYICNVARLGGGNTPQRQNSLEYTCVAVTANEIAVLVPRLTGLGVGLKLRGNPYVTSFVPFPDMDLDGDCFRKTLEKLGLRGKRVGVLQDISSSVVLMLQQDLAATVVNFDSPIQEMRAVKDADELVLMRKASEIADQIYKEIFPQLRPGVAVREIEWEIEKMAERFGASMSSFPSELLNNGPKAGEMVGMPYPIIEKGYTLAFDFGVVYQGYCSDFGRTMFVGEPTLQQVKLHELVMAAQKAGMEAMRAGTATGEDVNAAARRVIEEAGYGESFIHRLGHGIGKDVHERPFLAEGEKRLLQPGMTFTIEPSIFLPHQTLIRVEDVVLVTETGYEPLNTTTREVVVIAS